MEVEAISIDVLERELTQAPRLFSRGSRPHAWRLSLRDRFGFTTTVLAGLFHGSLYRLPIAVAVSGANSVLGMEISRNDATVHDYSPPCAFPGENGHCSEAASIRGFDSRPRLQAMRGLVGERGFRSTRRFD